MSEQFDVGEMPKKEADSDLLSEEEKKGNEEEIKITKENAIEKDIQRLINSIIEKKEKSEFDLENKEKQLEDCKMGYFKEDLLEEVKSNIEDEEQRDLLSNARYYFYTNLEHIELLFDRERDVPKVKKIIIPFVENNIKEIKEKIEGYKNKLENLETEKQEEKFKQHKREVLEGKREVIEERMERLKESKK